MYVVKQKCTTANVVIYSDISLFYYQKFFLLSLCKYTFLLIILTKTQNLIGGQVVHFCLTTYSHPKKLMERFRIHMQPPKSFHVLRWSHYALYPITILQ